MASSLKSFVTATPRQDEAAPLPPKNSIGKMPTGGQGPRPASLPREKGELYKYVSQWAGWGGKQKNTGSEQFRYLLRTMHEIEEMLRGKTTALALFKSEVEGAHPPAFHHM